MRNLQRIPELLDLLNQLWYQDPDLRFNQLIYNLQSEFSSQNGDLGKVVETTSDGFETIGFDLFNLEDDEFMDFLQKKLAGEQVQSTAKLEGIINAIEYGTHAELVGGAAYVNVKTAQTAITGDCVDEADIPDDLFENDDYIELPTKQELDLGRDLALQFASNQLPDEYERIYAAFRRRGAYGVFKDILAKHNQLEAWYKFEQQAQLEAVAQWCELNGIDVS